MKNKKLVMIPGPTPVTRSIQDQMGRETVGHGDPGFVKDFKETVKEMNTIFDNEKGETFLVAGTGTLAMEMGIANITEEGDDVLVISHGHFGNRYIEICETKGLKVDSIQSEWGEIVPVKDIEEKLEEKNYKALLVTHVDTSTGVAAPISEIGEMVKKFDDTMFVVDGVCATAAEKEYLDEMNIDILITGSQKAFGVAPGLAIVLAGPKAIEKRKSLGIIRDYYIDFDRWAPIMSDPSKYFGTPPVNLLWALQESVRLIKEEGIEERYDRHIKDAKAMQAALEGLGFKILADKDHRAVTLSCVAYMDGIDDAEFRKVLGEEGIVVAGGLKSFAGISFRLGHMGNIDTHFLVSTISAIERTLDRLGVKDVLGKGVGILTAELAK